MSNEVWLIIATIIGIALLLFLIMKVQLHAFVSLLIASLFIGLATGMSPMDIIDVIETGMGGTLGFIAVVVGLGAMFGEVLKVSGGAERLALTLIDKFGEKRSQWALGFTGFLVSIPVFLDVALVILIPIVYSLATKTRKSLLYYGIPLLAGLAVAHSFVPPTPGPMTVAAMLGVDLGWVILFGIAAGIPAMILAGPVFGKFIGNRIHLEIPDYQKLEEDVSAMQKERDMPSFKLVFSLILIPLVLILANTVTGAIVGDESTNLFAESIQFVGHPFVALIITVVLTFMLLGTRRGYTRGEVQEIATKALEPAGIIILITGAGGVFKEVLIQSGVGDVMGNLVVGVGLPLVIAAFLITTFVRVAQGSATVAMVTGAGLMSPIIAVSPVTQPELGLIAIAIASGATVLSHVNDSGFWLVNRFFGMTTGETLKSWTVMETIIGLTGFVVVLIISIFI
ncbi:gluconate:H+ symporter [Salinicoccus hispanicus]|uniref:Gluconate transporter n=1 Tax=Salinicoccus hispanicus TaxID=157225 RepID=A0A6N8U0S8_9STAP|nr:gluconate:H+ symporter [Salinicoccus hispanicus]MXQ51372.1 gluconate transporter [Salinicoccus hispanicus]